VPLAPIAGNTTFVIDNRPPFCYTGIISSTGLRVGMTPVLTGTYHPAILVQFSEAISATTVTTDTLFVTDGQGRRLAGGVTYDGTLNRASFTLGEAPVRGVWQPRHNRTWGPHLGFDTTRPRRRVTQPAAQHASIFLPHGAQWTRRRPFVGGFQPRSCRLDKPLNSDIIQRA